MNTALRTLALTLGATATLAACSDDSKPVADVLAEDSTLVREVMSANRDRLSGSFDTAASTPAIAATAPTAAPIASASPEPVETSPVATAPRTELLSSRRSPAAARRSGPRRAVATRSSSARRPSRAAANPNTMRTETASIVPAHTETRNTSEPARMKASALIPAGSELVLAADQRVCASMSRVGDQFQARIAEDVVGPIGVVIPKGTVATAQISSVRNDFNLDIASLTFEGHTYPIGSDVTDAEVEKVRTKSSRRATPIVAGVGLGATVGGVVGRDVKSAVIGAAGGALAGILASRPSYRTDQCLPEGGRITMKLSEPLKIALAD